MLLRDHLFVLAGRVLPAIRFLFDFVWNENKGKSIKISIINAHETNHRFDSLSDIYWEYSIHDFVSKIGDAVVAYRRIITSIMYLVFWLHAIFSSITRNNYFLSAVHRCRRGIWGDRLMILRYHWIYLWFSLLCSYFLRLFSFQTFWTVEKTHKIWQSYQKPTFIANQMVLM